ncbi:aminoglycoside 6-adenylyltransferase [Lachnospiraceae bacterium 54-53]
MRTEQEMFRLIIGTAREDERIRAVYMGGSRTNPNAVPDLFQDYDVVYIVEETGTFIRDRHWIDRFGERLFMQYPDENSDYPSDPESCYGWLIQFRDGNRLDLHVATRSYALRDMASDRLCRILLDKDGTLPEIPEASDESHWVKRPSEKEFLCTCNEFWWCLDNVAKGLWRKEIPYVHDMINLHIRPQLVKLLAWKIGLKTGFTCSIGKSGKDMHRWLSKEEWKRFLDTYGDAEPEHIWKAVMEMCGLFHETAGEVADRLLFSYNAAEAENCTRYLEHVRELPPDADKIYE